MEKQETGPGIVSRGNRRIPIICTCFFLSLSVHGGVITRWIGAGGNSLWTNPTNWDSLSVPGSNSDVIITNSGASHVVLNVDTMVASVTIGGGQTAAVLDLMGVTLEANGASVIGTNGTIEVISNSTFAGSGSLRNSGTIEIPAELGTVSFVLNCNFTNSSTIDVGTNSTLNFTGTNSTQFSLLDGTIFAGPGTVQFSAGNQDVNCDGVITVNSTVEFQRPGGTLFGQSTWTGLGLFRWQAGAIGGLTFAPDFHVEISASGTMLGDCTNQGSIRMIGTNNVLLSGSTLRNSGLFQIETNCYLGGPGVSGNFENTGTIKVPAEFGAQTFSLSCNFTNYGVIDVETNSLLDFPGINMAQFVLLEGTAFAGPGTVLFSAGDEDVQCQAVITVNGTIEFQRPTATLYWQSTWTGPGLFSLEAGAMTGVTFAPDFHAEISDGGFLFGDCTNQGSLRVFGDNQVFFSEGTFRNSGLFQIETNCYIGGQGMPANFENTGTIKVPADFGSQSLSLFCNFTNYGIIDVETNSTLDIPGFTGYATPQFLLLDGTTFVGPGTVRFSGTDEVVESHGTMTVNGTIEFQRQSATIFGQSTWTGPGLLRFQAGGIGGVSFAPDFHVEFAGLQTVYLDCTNQGTIRLTMPSNVAMNGGTFHNSGLFQIETNCNLGGYLQSGNFENTGTIKVPAGLGAQTVLVTCNFTNYGTIDVETNSLLDLPGTNTAQFFLASGTAVTGPGTVRFSTTESALTCLGVITVNGNIEFQRALGAIYGQSTWTGPGLLRLEAGGIGFVTFAPDFHVEMSGTASIFGDCTNQGSIRLVGNPHLRMVNATLYNSGVFQLETNCYMEGFPGYLQNSGTIKVPTALGPQTLTLDNCNLTNYGTVDVETNSELNLAGTNSAPNNVLMSFFDGSIFDGAGILRLLPRDSSVSCLGTMNVNNTVEYQSQGIMYGPSKWTGPGLLRWSGGGMISFTFAPDFHAEISGPAGKYLSLSCTNQGTLRWLGGGNLAGSYLGPEVLFNEGILQVETNGFWWDFQLTNDPVGTFHQVAGDLTVDTFGNRGTARLESGKLTVQNNVSCASNSTWQVFLSGVAPVTNFNQLTAENLALGGSLQVTLTNGFSPAEGDTFVIANDTSSQSGRFDSVTLPALQSNLVWHVRYAPTSVVLEVAQPFALAKVGFTNGYFQFSLNGYGANSYDIQTSTNLVDWTTVESNSPFPGTVNFSDTNAPGAVPRYYRGRIFE